MVTPAELAAYIKVLRDGGLARADVTLGPDVRLVAEFSPAALPMPGVTPEPGGWKSPRKLDDPDALYPNDPGPGDLNVEF